MYCCCPSSRGGGAPCARSRRARFDVATECSSAGTDPEAMESLFNRATRTSDGRVTAPGLVELVHAIWDDEGTMIQAVKGRRRAGRRCGVGTPLRDQTSSCAEREIYDTADHVHLKVRSSAWPTYPWNVLRDAGTSTGWAPSSINGPAVGQRRRARWLRSWQSIGGAVSRCSDTECRAAVPEPST